MGTQVMKIKGVSMLRIVMSCFFVFTFYGQVFASEPILPIVAPNHLNDAKVTLGEQLFHEAGLSADGQVSCATCHDLSLGGVDRLSFSIGVYGKHGDMNAPTVFNSALSFRQFWDGRATSLEEQTEGPITNPREMANTWANVITFLQQDALYKDAFQSIYSTGITRESIKDAIVEFERSLTLAGSRFDQYLKGDTKAISDAEEQGYKLFKNYGCVACHQGVAVGGNMFQKIGVMRDFFVGEKRKLHPHDLGRFNATGNPEDKFVFKVPSLRMVYLTPPYFHDGSVETLREAIQLMGKYQLGLDIPDEDVLLIEQFLHTLPGLYQGEAW